LEYIAKRRKMTREDNNRGQKDGSKFREAEKKDWAGNTIANIIGTSDYKPPKDKERKKDYDSGFRNAYKRK
jgi:hypothetical protein